MKYLVTGSIKRDGKPLKVGSVAEFETEEGDRLMAGGYLSGPSAADRAVAESAGEEAKTQAAKKASKS
jgi:hypothetical protein